MLVSFSPEAMPPLLAVCEASFIPLVMMRPFHSSSEFFTHAFSVLRSMTEACSACEAQQYVERLLQTKVVALAFERLDDSGTARSGTCVQFLARTLARCPVFPSDEVNDGFWEAVLDSTPLQYSRLVSELNAPPSASTELYEYTRLRILALRVRADPENLSATDLEPVLHAVFVRCRSPLSLLHACLLLALLGARLPPSAGARLPLALIAQHNLLWRWLWTHGIGAHTHDANELLLRAGADLPVLAAQLAPFPRAIYALLALLRQQACERRHVTALLCTLQRMAPREHADAVEIAVLPLLSDADPLIAANALAVLTACGSRADALWHAAFAAFEYGERVCALSAFRVLVPRAADTPRPPPPHRSLQCLLRLVPELLNGDENEMALSVDLCADLCRIERRDVAALSSAQILRLLGHANINVQCALFRLVVTLLDLDLLDLGFDLACKLCLSSANALVAHSQRLESVLLLLTMRSRAPEQWREMMTATDTARSLIESSIEISLHDNSPTQLPLLLLLSCLCTEAHLTADVLRSFVQVNLSCPNPHSSCRMRFVALRRLCGSVDNDLLHLIADREKACASPHHAPCAECEKNAHLLGVMEDLLLDCEPVVQQDVVPKRKRGRPRKHPAVTTADVCARTNRTYEAVPLSLRIRIPKSVLRNLNVKLSQPSTRRHSLQASSERDSTAVPALYHPSSPQISIQSPSTESQLDSDPVWNEESRNSPQPQKEDSTQGYMGMEARPRPYNDPVWHESRNLPQSQEEDSTRRIRIPKSVLRNLNIKLSQSSTRRHSSQTSSERGPITVPASYHPPSPQISMQSPATESQLDSDPVWHESRNSPQPQKQDSTQKSMGMEPRPQLGNDAAWRECRNSAQPKKENATQQFTGMESRSQLDNDTVWRESRKSAQFQEEHLTQKSTGMDPRPQLMDNDEDSVWRDPRNSAQLQQEDATQKSWRIESQLDHELLCRSVPKEDESGAKGATPAITPSRSPSNGSLNCSSVGANVCSKRVQYNGNGDKLREILTRIHPAPFDPNFDAQSLTPPESPALD